MYVWGGAFGELLPSATACEANRRALFFTVSGEEAQHSSFLRVRASLRWLWSAQILKDSAASAGGLSSSPRGCGATCQLPPPTPSQLKRAKQVQTCWL